MVLLELGQAACQILVPKAIQRLIDAVTSSKSASSTPFETNRGAQCEIAEATRASADTAATAA